jgi:hypothetical protein
MSHLDTLPRIPTLPRPLIGLKTPAAGSRCNDRDIRGGQRLQWSDVYLCRLIMLLDSTCVSRHRNSRAGSAIAETFISLQGGDRVYPGMHGRREDAGCESWIWP